LFVIRKDNAGRTITQETQEQYIMLLKHISLAAVAATFITGGAAVANAESQIGVQGAGGDQTTEAALVSHTTPFSGSGYAGDSYASMSPHGYSRPARSHRHIRR
jgi:hypothetical protein